MLRAAFALITAILVAAGSPAVSAQQQPKWEETAALTSEQGYLLGNPAAKVKLVEYVSLTCSHCRTFAEQSMETLTRDYITSGRVSYEIRPYPLDVIAATAAQLTYCLPPEKGLLMTFAFLGAQDQILESAEALSDEDVNAMEALAPADYRVAVAAKTRVTELGSLFGVAEPEVRACLSDQARADRLETAVEAAEALGVSGTPAFMLNGQLIGSHDWQTLEPLIKQAGG